MELILCHKCNFSFQFYLQQAEDNSTVNICIQFSSYHTLIQPSAFSEAFGLCVLSVPSLHGNLDVKTMSIIIIVFIHGQCMLHDFNYWSDLKSYAPIAKTFMFLPSNVTITGDVTFANK